MRFTLAGRPGLPSHARMYAAAANSWRMSVSRAPAPAVQSALRALIDYAGLFPPAELGMVRAVERYEEARRGPYGWMLGRFIVPATRLTELLNALGDREPFDLSVLLDAGSDSGVWLETMRRLLDSIASLRDRESLVRIGALETRLPQLGSERDTFDAPIGQFGMLAGNAGVRDLPIFVELPRGPRWEAELPTSLFALARTKLGAKVRCGGASASDVPSAGELASFVHECTQQSIAWKATAGLHRPIRHGDAAAGFAMHGFLNLLCAAVFAKMGADIETLRAMLEEEDPSAFALDAAGLRAGDLHASLDDISNARRRHFVAYGSCSFEEPTHELTAMGIV